MPKLLLLPSGEKAGMRGMLLDCPCPLTPALSPKGRGSRIVKLRDFECPFVCETIMKKALKRLNSKI
jgi:hypothetical protein